MKKKKILMVTTGGTILSVPQKNGLIPGDNACLSSVLLPLSHLFSVEVRELMRIDSSSIKPENWSLMAKFIFERMKDYNGVVIVHGTDTMAYTASVLTFMLQNPSIPIVLTGSQLPLSNPFSDAPENLRTALLMASSEIPGIFLAFHRKILLGCRAVKARSQHFDAFESINFPYIATLNAEGMKIFREYLPKAQKDPQLFENFSHDVFLLKWIPGLTPQIFDALCYMGYRGVVIEAFGLGGIGFTHEDLSPRLHQLIQGGISVVVCSQCLYDKSDLEIYEVGQKLLELGVIEGRDMTTEAAVAKLSWALGQNMNPDEIRYTFRKNLAGEISI